eukprot:gene22582-27256_t
MLCTARGTCESAILDDDKYDNNNDTVFSKDNKPPGGRWSKVLETLGIGQDKPKESEEWGGVELSTSMYQRPVGPAQQ